MNTSFSTPRIHHRQPAHGADRRANWLSAMVATWRQRHALDQLDDRMLRDIGVSRKEAADEVGRPIWDVPGHWLR